jgi:ferredoxin
VKIDPNLRVGSGNCEAECPNLFKVANGISQLQEDTVPQAEENCAQEAADGCPAGAIAITYGGTQGSICLHDLPAVRPRGHLQRQIVNYSFAQVIK